MRFLAIVLLSLLPSVASAQTPRPAFDVPFWTGVIGAETCGSAELVTALRDPRGRTQCKADGRECFERSTLLLARMCGAGLDEVAVSPCAAEFDADSAEGLLCLVNHNHSVPHPVLAAQMDAESRMSAETFAVVGRLGGIMDVAPRQLVLSMEEATEEDPNPLYLAHRAAVLERAAALAQTIPRPGDIRAYSRMSLPDRRRIMEALGTSIGLLSDECPFNSGGRSSIEAVFDTPETTSSLDRLGEALLALQQALNGQEPSMAPLSPPSPPEVSDRCKALRLTFPYQSLVSAAGSPFGMTERQR